MGGCGCGCVWIQGRGRRQKEGGRGVESEGNWDRGEMKERRIGECLCRRRQCKSAMCAAQRTWWDPKHVPARERTAKEGWN